jgi:hypothetical protein
MGEWQGARCGLSDVNMRAGHGFATIGVLLVMRHARHRLAALHCLLGCGHAHAIETVQGKRTSQQGGANSASGSDHKNKTKRSLRFQSMRFSNGES